MAEKNTNDNQKSNKKHKWIGIFLIALLLLFIGLAGYYLERDLEPVPDNQIEDEEVIEEDSGGPDEESAEEQEQLQELEEQDLEEEAAPEEESEAGEQISDIEETEADDDQEIDTGDEVEVPENGEAVSEVEPDAEKSKDTEETEAETEVDQSSTDRDADSGAVEDTESLQIESPDKEEAAPEEDSGEISEPGTDKTVEEVENQEEAQSEITESQIDEDSEEIEEQDSETAETEESDLEEVPAEEPAEELSEIETERDSEVEEDVEEEIEDSSLIDRILSILGLADSDFTQDLNILVVGLDDEESVAIGSIEADSIMLAKLRPEDNKMQIEHIDEDTEYKGELLRDYHDGDIQPAVEEISGSKVDYHVYVNYLGFEKVIDELGGVKITLDQDIEVPGLGLNLKAGDNLLSGKEALNFVRWRDSDSLERFERQKLLINSVMTKLKSNNILFNVKELYNTIVESYNSIETDINPVLAAEIFNYLRENKELELEYIE